MRRTRHLHNNEDGAVLILSAFILLLVLGLGAFAVDAGRVAVTSRDQQGATDRAALDGVLELSRSSEPFSTVPVAVAESLGRNLGVAGSGMSSPRELVSVELGLWDPVDRTFTPMEPCPLCKPDAVRVQTLSTVSAVFLRNHSEVTRTSIARLEAIGTIAVRSATATANPVALNALASELLGDDVDVSLDAVAWNGLFGANLNLGDLAAALGVGSIDELVDANVTVAELASAMATALPAEGNDSVRAALNQFELAAPTLPPVSVGDVLAVDQGAGSALGADVNAFDLIMGAAQAANQGNFLDLDLAVAGVGGMRLQLVEPPQIAVGRAGEREPGTWRTTARTAQTRLEVDVPLGAVPTFDILGSSLRLLDDDLTARIGTGRGTSHLTQAGCADPRTIGTRVDGSATTLSLDEVLVLDGQVANVNLLGIQIGLARVRAWVEMPQTTLAPAGPADHVFVEPEAGWPADWQPVGTSDPAIGQVLRNGLVVRGRVDLLSGILPLGLTTDLVEQTVTDVLAPVLAELDGPLDEVLGSLGVTLGQVEDRGVDLDCSGRALVR